MKLVLLIVLLSISPFASAQDTHEYVLPAFAHRHPGVGDNLWSSEVFITNPSSATAAVRLVEFLPGTVDPSFPCAPPQGAPREVPPFQTIVWTARDVAFEMGCYDEMVGGLVVAADREVSITSRMVNEQIQDEPADGGFIPGFGLEVPAVPFSEATLPGERLLLPTLVWHPRACTNPGFETAIGIANLDDSAITISLRFTGDAPPERVYINGRLVTSPFEFSVRARGWKQVSFGPPDGDGDECAPAEVFDLEIDPTGPVVAYGTVVDRSTQDGRIVRPVAIVEDATSN
jgi:hypothetical protein